MTDTRGEQLSSFLDGELPRAEFELLLNRMDRDVQLRGALTRYAAIGECLRGEPDRLSRGFTAKVCSAVAVEAAGRKPALARLARNRQLRRAGQLAGGLALAASVAGVAILILQREQSALTPSAQQTAANNDSPAETVVVGNPASGEGFSYTVPAPAQTTPVLAGARLTDYVFAHSEYSSLLGRRNILSSVIAEDPIPVEPNEQEADDGSRP